MLKKLLFTLVVMLFLSSCGISKINYAKNRLTLQLGEKSLLLDTVLLHKSINNFSSLFIYKKILHLNEGNIIVYENAKTDLNYEFFPTTTTIIKVIFEALSADMIYANSNLYVFRVTLGNGSILNVIAQQDETQQLQLIYGLSNKQLNMTIKQLDPNANIYLYNKAITLNSMNSTSLTKWDIEKIHFFPLVVPLSIRLGM
jgi:hypothetical protein